MADKFPASTHDLGKRPVIWAEFDTNRSPLNSATEGTRNKSISGPAAEDQKHTFNAFANYRLTSTVNLSAKFIYGSGFPSLNNDVSVLSGGISVNSIVAIRFPAYQRLDIRADKSWTFQHWKMTLHVEGLNMTNHNNPQVIGSCVGGILDSMKCATKRSSNRHPARRLRAGWRILPAYAGE